jgi:hypothetical protein
MAGFPDPIIPWVRSKPSKHLEALQISLRSNVQAATVSFSRHRESLTQFRMYAPETGGFAIGLPRSYLTGIADLLDCDYEPKHMENWCLGYVRGFFEHAQRIDDGKMSAQDLHSAIYSTTDLFQRRLVAQLKYKSAEFSAEGEVRLCKFGRCTKFRVSRGENAVVPYQVLELPNTAGLDVEIVCGPNRDPRLGELSTWELIAAATEAGTVWGFRSHGESTSTFRA